MIGPSSSATFCSPMKKEDNPYIALEALLLADPLVPVLAVPGEVELLSLPLLALPEGVQLRVAEESDVGRGVGGLEQGGIGGGLEVLALGAGLGPGRLRVACVSPGWRVWTTSRGSVSTPPRP